MTLTDIPAIAAGAGGIAALFAAIKGIKIVAAFLGGVRDYFGRVKAEVELLRSLPAQIEKIATTPTVAPAVTPVAAPVAPVEAPQA